MTTPAARSALPRLRPYQAEAGRAIVGSVLRGEGRSFSVEIARQGGKNELSAQIEAFLLMTNAGRSVDGIKCAPTFQPQAKISLQRLLARLRGAGLAPPAELEEGRAVRLGGARILFLSAEPGASVVGHTVGLLLEVDEAQDVDPDHFDHAFRPMAAATGATIVYYGTAWDDATLLERAKRHHLEMERRDGVRRHFEYDWRVVAAHNPAYARYVEGERQRLGEDHPLFRTQYLLQTLDGEGRLFPPHLLRLLEGDHLRLSGPDGTDGVYVAGLDLAGEASEPGGGSERDSTVLSVGRVRYPDDGPLAGEPQIEVVQTLAWSGVAYDELYAALAGQLDRVWGVARVAVDATGLGGPAVRFLRRALGGDRVEAVTFSPESKSQLGYALLAAANTGRLRLYRADGSPEYRTCRHELERARVEYRPDRRMRFFVPPAEGHDDYVMSLALLSTAALGARPRPRRVATGRATKGGALGGSN